MMLNTKAIEKRKEAIANGAMPVLREAGFSYQAKGQLQKMGFEANTSLRDLSENVKDYLEAGASMRVACEITKKVRKYKLQSKLADGQ